MDITPETAITEHHPSCRERCVRECAASPRHAPRSPAPRIRTFHTGPVEPLDKAPPPLWEHVDDFAAVRASGCAIPLPETYVAFSRADERYSLDRWTRPGGTQDRALDEAIRHRDETRKSHARRAPDIGEIAALVRAAFGVSVASKPSAAVRRGRVSARSAELLRLVTGEAAPSEQHAPMHEACAHIRDVFKAHAWALALILFGRERDPLSDYAFGRLFKGEPIRDMRPPFANASHALTVASHDLPGLGGGSCPWPQDDPRMATRTWSRPDEMKVGSTFVGSTRIRGEAAVDRALDARAAVRRAGLSAHERAAVAVLADRDLSRAHKEDMLRRLEANRLGVDVDDLTTPLAEILRAARAAEKRLRVAVERVSLAGDALAPKRPAPARARLTPPPRTIRPARSMLFGGAS